LKSKNSLLKNGIFNLAGGAVRTIAGVVTVPIMIRFLGIEEYGLWTLASSVLGVVNLAEAGLSTATTVYASRDLNKKDYVGLAETIAISSAFMFLLASIAGTALYLCSPLIIKWYLDLNSAQSIALLHSLQIGGLVVWCRLLQQILVGIEQAYQRYDLLNIISTISSVLASIGTITIVFLSGKTLQIMQYQLCVGVASLLMHYYIVRKLVGKINKKISLNTKKAIEMGKYSLMMSITSIGGVLFTRVDRLVIGSVLGASYLGVYSAITDIASQINILSAMAVQPLVSSISSENIVNSEIVRRQIKQSLLVNLYISLFLGLLINAISPLVLSILLKQSIENLPVSYLYSFKLGVFIYSLYSVNGSSYYVLLGSKQVSVCSRISLLTGIISIILICTGAIQLGLIGAIIGNAGFLGVYAFTFTAMKASGISSNNYFKDLLHPIICFTITSVILIFVNPEILISSALSLFSLIIISLMVKKSFDNITIK
jgi:O-antigen/teichoic acid export membrane protein